MYNLGNINLSVRFIHDFYMFLQMNSNRFHIKKWIKQPSAAPRGYRWLILWWCSLCGNVCKCEYNPMSEWLSIPPRQWCNGLVSLKRSQFPSGELFITAIQERSLPSDANSASVEGSRAFRFPECFKYLNKFDWVAFDLLGWFVAFNFLWISIQKIFNIKIKLVFFCFFYYLGSISRQPGVPHTPDNRDSSVLCSHTNQLSSCSHKSSICLVILKTQLRRDWVLIIKLTERTGE